MIRDRGTFHDWRSRRHPAPAGRGDAMVVFGIAVALAVGLLVLLRAALEVWL